MSVADLNPSGPRRVVRSNMSAAVRDRIQELIFDGTLKSGAGGFDYLCTAKR